MAATPAPVRAVATMSTRSEPALDRAPTAVRRATPADLPALARMLARAYSEDPVAIWACAADGLRPKMLERLYSARLRQMLAHEEVWITPELTSAAVWLPPGRRKATPRQQLALARCVLHPRLLVRAPLLAIGLLGMERRHPGSPDHWYLSLLGTDPDAQGKGLGSAVLAPVLERCEHDGACVYLETAKERNVDFYIRRGFRVSGEYRLPRGPRMWLMWRSPRAGAVA
jgi:ribosomal protein S18 acetylase RimI-like enzyme